MSQGPPVLVFPVTAPALQGINQGGRLFTGKVLPLCEALETEWGQEMAFVAYTTHDPDGFDPTEQPRLAKNALPSIQRAGGEVKVSLLILDFDLKDWKQTEGKLPWSEPLVEEFHKALMAADTKWATNWSLMYYTPHGARLIWELAEPCGPLHAEGYLRGLGNEFERVGLPVDAGTMDWTRIWKLPYITTDQGDQTWDNPYVGIEDAREVNPKLPPASFPFSEKGSGSSSRAEIDPNDLDYRKPEPEQAKALVELPEGGLTWWARQARKWSRNNRYYSACFEHAPIASPGNRNNRIMQLVGEAVSVLSPLDGTSAEHIYGLFLTAVEQLEPDSGTPDWTDVLWRMVLYAWARERAEARERKKEREAEEEGLDPVRWRIIKQARHHCVDKKAELFHDDLEVAWNWMSTRLIALTAANTCHVMTHSGHYDREGVRKDQIHVRIKDLGVEDIIPLHSTGKEGQRVPRTKDAIINRHGTIVVDCIGTPGVPGTYIDRLGGRNQVLKVRLYGLRTDVTPKYSPEVDAWLRAFAGKEYETICHWVGHALDLSGEPICALSLVGWPGCGKKMFVQGLCECIDGSQEPAGDEELIGNYQYKLLDTPFVLVNEGWKEGFKSSDIADRFRHAVSGDTITSNRKFLAPVQVNSPLRVILAANNYQVVNQIFGNRDLSEQDREALTCRILHIELPREASDWLHNQGGKRYTEGWIRGDGGQKSDAVIARHFLWLYERRHSLPRGSAKQSDRFLVAGNNHPRLIHSMRTLSGVSPEIIECLLLMINTPGLKGMTIVPSESSVYVTADAVLRFYRKTFAHSRMSMKQLRPALNALNKRGDNKGIYAIEQDNGKKTSAMRWIELDLEPLVEEALDRGVAGDRLYEIAPPHLLERMLGRNQG